jgi:hypothetical protein
MNLNFASKPFSTVELVAGSAALAPVALIAFFGLQVPRSQDLLPTVPSSLSTASILLSQSVSWSSDEQFSQPSQNASAGRKPRPVGSGLEGDNVILPEAASTKATGSPPADRSLIAATWLGRSRFDGAAGAERRLIEAGLLWGFADGIETTVSPYTRCGVLSPDATGSYEVRDRPTQSKSFATSCDPNLAESRADPSTQDRAAKAAIAPSPPLEQNPPGRLGEDAFVGGWADDTGECRQYQNHGAPPLVISTHAAKTASSKCDFRFIRQEAASRWRIVALCSREGKSWTAHVDLTLAGSDLTWSSERGTARYIRCLRS